MNPNNTMPIAFAEAGIKPPTQHQIVWQWLKDNGAHTAEEISAALPHWNRAKATILVSELKNRKLVESTTEFDVRKKKDVMKHTALGAVWEPVSRGRVKGNKAKVVAKKTAASPAPSLEEMKSQYIVKPFSPKTIIATLTYGQMEELHAFLGRFFK